MQKPRGVLPTLSGDSHLALCKAGPRVRNTYEVRLCLYSAVTDGKQFLLVVRPNATIDATLESHLATYGGRVVRDAVPDYSVYFGAEDAAGREIDGWVACNGAQWMDILARATSDWLRDNLVLGREFHGTELKRLRVECRNAHLAGTNIDDEPLADAILRLIDAADATEGRVFIQ